MENLHESMYTAVSRGREDCRKGVAAVFFGRRMTYGELFSRIDFLADNLAARVGKGDRVTLCMPNSPSALVAFYALNKLGAVVNLCHPFLPPEALCRSAETSGSRLIILFDQYFDRFESAEFTLPLLVSDCGAFMGRAVRLGYRWSRIGKKQKYGRLEDLMRDRGAPRLSAAAFAPSEPAVYLSSGGTTGSPKTIKLGNYAMNYLCAQAQCFLSRPLGEYGAMYSVLPIFHGFGLCMNMHMCMTLKLKNVMCIRFSARAMAKALEKEKINIVTGVPTMYHKLLAEKRFAKADLSSLYDAFAGGDTVSAELLRDFTAAMRRGGSAGRLYAGYGLTETVTVCAVNSAKHCKEGSVGYPVPGTKFRVAREREDGSFEFLPAGETGEVHISTPQLMLGYLGGESSTYEEDGETWLRTGDEGYLDGEGFLYFRQRIKNIFKVSGVPVYPSEIEEAVAGVAGVGKVCAVPEKDAVRGNSVKLYAEAAEGADLDALREELLRRAREKLLPYAVPRKIAFVDKLPLSLIGKVDRVRLMNGEWKGEER